MAISFLFRGNSRDFRPLDNRYNYEYSEDEYHLHPFCFYPDTFWDDPDVGNAVQAHVDHIIEKQCFAYLRWCWKHGDKDWRSELYENDDEEGGWGDADKERWWDDFREKNLPDGDWKKLKLYKASYDKLSWMNCLWDLGLHTVGYERPRSASGVSPEESKRAQKHAKKMARIQIDDVLREIEKYLMKWIKKDFIKLSEKDLCKMVHEHEHAAAKEKIPGMQNVLTSAAKLAYRNYASACGGNWGYVSAHWQQSRTPGDVLRLQFERYNGKIVVLSAADMHYHWRCSNGESENARTGSGRYLGQQEERERDFACSHPVLMLADAWFEKHHFMPS